MSTISDQVTRLYDTIFDRAPDPEGMGFWVNAMENGTPLDTVAMLFMRSGEWQAAYGTPDSTAFVNLLYQNVLDRQPDAEGRSFWVAGLEQGLVRREAVVVGFSESAEHIANMGMPPLTSPPPAPQPEPQEPSGPASGNPPPPAPQVFYGTPGNDELLGSDGADIMFGFGADAVARSDRPEVAPVPNPTLSAFGWGEDRLHGFGGNDRLYGGGLSDVLQGGDGGDWLWGGEGRDILIGGEGADIFVFQRTNGPLSHPDTFREGIRTGADIIVDFERGRDSISLTGYQNPNDPGGRFIGTADFSDGTQLEARYRYDEQYTILEFKAPIAAAGTPPAERPATIFPEVGEIRITGHMVLTDSDIFF